MEPQLSLILPCLNEAATLAGCLTQAQKMFERLQQPYEIIVVDNGSTDHSAGIARSFEVHLIRERPRGYGRALRAGLAVSRGTYLFFADSDGSYDLTELPRFLKALHEGADLVLGSRFTGLIEPGAMPWIHRSIGNPLLTWLANRLFKMALSDSLTGFRAFRKEAYQRLHLVSPGMEFAQEMLIRARQIGLKIREVPISYRRTPPQRHSKLHLIRDGWRLVAMLLREAFVTKVPLAQSTLNLH